MLQPLLGLYLLVVLFVVAQSFLRAKKQLRAKKNSSHTQSPAGQREGGEESVNENGDARSKTRSVNVLDQPLDEGSLYSSPAERERGSDLTRPLLQPLGRDLFRQDKMDDLTRPWGQNEEETETFDLFEEDKKDDLTR